MTVQTINIGNAVNDGLGDDLRTAFEKVNANFQSLDQGLTVTARNLNNTGVGIFSQKVGSELQFKSLVAGTGIVLDGSNPSSVVITSTLQGSFTRITTEDGLINAIDQPIINLRGGTNISVVKDPIDNQILIDTRVNLEQLFTSYDFGVIGSMYQNVFELLLNAVNIDFGTFSNPSLLTFDLGEF